MILVSYDGSDDAKAAIEHVAQLVPGAETAVVTVWEPYLDTLVRSGMGLGTGMSGVYVGDEELDDGIRAAALAQATEGASLAAAAGLVPTARRETRHGSVGNTLLVLAEELDADLIVVGTRGRSAAKSFLLGSVSHDVLQHADRPVLIAPSAALAADRHQHLDRNTAAA